MPDTLPIACSLSANDMRQRLTEIAALGADALIAVQRTRTHAELRFAAGDAVRDRVAAIARAEMECCPFLTIEVGDSRGALVLTIDAPEDAELVLEELVEAFAAAA